MKSESHNSGLAFNIIRRQYIRNRNDRWRINPLRMGGCRCSYKTCKSATKTHQELHFFHYPVKTRERCMEWIQNADRVEFSYLPNDQLRNKVICGLHFRDSCFTNELRKRLVHDAVPTLDVGCEPEEDEAPPAEENLDYMAMQRAFDGEEESGDSSSMNATAFMGDGSVATIKATGGDGCTFSLDTDPYVEMQQKPHLITYNFVNGSLVPTITSDVAASTTGAARNGNVQAPNATPQPHYDAYDSIFGGDPSNTQLQYIAAGDCTVATVQSGTIRARSNPGGGRSNHGASSAAAVTVNRVDEGMDSYMLTYVQDPLADDDGVDNNNYGSEGVGSTNNRRGRHHAITTFNIRRTGCVDDDQSGGECVIQLETHANDEEIRAVHILPGHHNYTDGMDDGDDGESIMVSAEEIVPDNTQRHRPKAQQHHHVPDVIDICGDDDMVIVGGGSLFGGDVDMDLLPPLHAPIVHMSPRSQPPLQQPPSLLHRAVVPAAKQHRTNNNNKKNKVVHIQQTDIVRPLLETTSTQIRHAGDPAQPQRALGKKTTYTFVTTASVPAATSTPLKPIVSRTSTAAQPTVTSASSNQRTTTFIKSTMPSHGNPRPKPQILRTEIQKIIQGGGVTKNCQANTSVVGANKATVSHTVVSATVGANATLSPIATASPNTAISSGARKREASTSLAALRTELPPSMYSAIAIHLQRKRAFFDTAETEFLTTLYTSTPKGYTTLRNKLGWELPDEETVKELLELREN